MKIKGLERCKCIWDIKDHWQFTSPKGTKFHIAKTGWRGEPYEIYEGGLNHTNEVCEHDLLTCFGCAGSLKWAVKKILDFDNQKGAL